MKKNAFTTVPERFMKPYEIPKAKLDHAITKALDKLEQDIPKWQDSFSGLYSFDYKYFTFPNNNWVCGMWTGQYLLAYELSGNKKFLEVAEKQLATYQERIDKKVRLDDHDVGFVFLPSCVAAYKLFGEEKYKQIAIDAAEYFYNTSYSKKGGFILRGWNWEGDAGCRTMMDTLMNAPLFLWAGQETGNKEWFEAGLSQNKVTAEILIRDDGSSCHHYQFDVENHKPLHEVTLQGHADDSCWSRGHAWGVYGFPIAYAYTKADFLVDVHKDITYYMLNKLPEDLVPYWDYDFTSGDEPRDSSAGVISVCGLHEMARLLPDDAPQKAIYRSAAAQILEGTIDRCTGDIGKPYDGLLVDVTAGVPQGIGIAECAVYGDYHYLEALTRFAKPDWVRYW